MKSYNESDSENDSNGNNQSENSVYWCFNEASEYKGWVIKLDLTTPVKFQEKVIIIKKKKIKVMNMVKMMLKIIVKKVIKAIVMMRVRIRMNKMMKVIVIVIMVIKFISVLMRLVSRTPGHVKLD